MFGSSEGFQTIVLPIKAGAIHKFAAIDVKLKGVIANTNPSKGLYSILFQIPELFSGWSE